MQARAPAEQPTRPAARDEGREQRVEGVVVHLRRVDGGARREVDPRPPTGRRGGGEGDAGAERGGGDELAK